jgi:nucleoside 2-deoxyribosyltransferase
MPIGPQNHLALEAQVEKTLRDAGINYQKDMVVGKARPDFVVTTEKGDQIVVEVKAWEARPDSTARAINQAHRYKEMSKTDAAIIVTSAVLESIASAVIAVTPMGGLINALAGLTNTLAQSKKSRHPQPTQLAPKKKVFASMPFASQYDDTFLVAIDPASLVNGAIAERVDHNGTAGPVVPQIKAMIEAAKVVIADLSDSRPNVLHEIGYAEALQKPVIQICCTLPAALPFNVRNNRTIQYAIGQTARLRKTLETEIKKYV